MGRKNRKVQNYDPYFEEELYKEFLDNEEMRIAKTEGKKIDLKIKKVEPKTKNQELVFEYYKYGNNIVMSGAPGSGKTYLAFYLALCEVLAKKYKKLIIVRSAVASRDIGFLPGTLEEKIDIFKLPYKDICNRLFDIPDAYQRLEKLGLIEFTTTSFLRGLNFDDCIIVVDEVQNMNSWEIDTVVTRMCDKSKIIFTGDYNQRDLHGKKNDESGIKELIRVSEKIDTLKLVEFTIEDILRSSFVKEYIIARMN